MRIGGEAGLEEMSRKLFGSSFGEMQSEEILTPDGLLLCGFRSDRADLIELWSKARSLHSETGLWPIISHDGPRTWEWFPEETRRGRRSVDHDEAGGSEGTPEGVIAELVDAVWKGEEGCSGYRTAFGGIDLAELVAKIEEVPTPADPRSENIRFMAGFMGKPEWLCLIPAENSWQLPVLLDAPDTPNWLGSSTHPSLTLADHASVLESWHRRFGAEVFYLGSRELGLTVTRPPTDPLIVAEMAIEHWSFCYDLDQIIGDIAKVGKLQVPADHWLFWWD
ncbi:DUF4253 domain-containing protein [Streptomyces sp900105755]|uniref:DUF4253 domain-containing protein n=1 Tax=Streptomyces sp. 900105755 TaxID=3154389 RepID=A0ABV1T8B2_9ACTN